MTPPSTDGPVGGSDDASDGATDGGTDGAATDVPGVTCAVCGRTVAELPLTWSSAVETRRGVKRTLHHCDTCSRDNLRAIEGKLDQEWW